MSSKSPKSTVILVSRGDQGRRFLGLLTFAIAATLTFLYWAPTTFNPLDRVSAPRIDVKGISNPADQWKDEWPYREQEPWDISTDFPYPRSLEFEVDEGTWQRLDVHPTSGEIVFDLLGDIYCLTPGSTRAHPILLGVPQDGDPRFSPEGDRLIFRSDAKLGVDNIWITEWNGCHAAALRPDPELQRDGTFVHDELLVALASKREDEELLSAGIKETPTRRRKRLIREGRLHTQRVTNETYRFVTDARFHPSGTRVIASKWYTSQRSIPAGEGWQYNVPDLKSLRERSENKIRSGDGKRIIERKLPPGWSASQYGDQQIGNEQFIWKGNDMLIFSKKSRQEQSGLFSYSDDVHAGIYGIYSRNITTGRTESLVEPFPGGASRPELSRDGNTLAFVRRVRDKEALVFLDLRSGSLHNIWHGLTYDATPIAAPMGTYPSFAFIPKDDGIIIWAVGKLWRVPLSANPRGEKIAGGAPVQIPFKARIEKRLAKTLHASTNILKTETAKRQRVHAFKGLTVDDNGDNVLFQAAGTTYIQAVGSGSQPVAVPVLDSGAAYYSPSFVPNSPNLVVHSKWTETNFTTFELANVLTGTVYDLSFGLPFGRYISPVLCECTSPERKIAFVRLPGDLLSGDVLATGGSGIMMADITLPHSTPRTQVAVPPAVVLRNVEAISLDVDLDFSSLKLRFVDKANKLLVQDASRSILVDIAGGHDEFGHYKHDVLVTAKTSTELAAVPITVPSSIDGHSTKVQRAAFVDFYHVYFVDGENIHGNTLQSKPGNATHGIIRLSVDGGHDISWSKDGKKLFWLLGPYLHFIDISRLPSCESEVNVDPMTFGIKCTRALPNFQEVKIWYESDVTRLSRDARTAAILETKQPAEIENADVLAIVNATLLTFHTGSFDTDYIPGGVLVSKAGVITQAGSASQIRIPRGAHIIDASGGLLIPGYVDVHAHWGGFSVPHPTRSWELETFLAYGITTVHNPSSDNRDGFNERFFVESGKSLGPRIFHTGNVIYGAGTNGIHQDIVNMDEARSALLRIKAEGGPSSFSYKNYQLPSRASRQRLILAARNLSMIVVPEGGMSFDWDLTYIIDGMTTIEHAIPIPTLHEDVIHLYAQSGTASTPTHIVNYGGAMGEQFVWAGLDLPNDPKLRRFTRHDILEGLSESTSRPHESYALFNTSASVAKLVRQGTLANIGAHGEPPLGLMYHAEMKFAQAGGLDTYEVLRAATRDGARSLGLFDSIGSLATGKLADMVLYPEGVGFDQFHDLSPSKDPRFVVRGGRVFEAENMEEHWPVKGRKQRLPKINAE